MYKPNIHIFGLHMTSQVLPVAWGSSANRGTTWIQSHCHDVGGRETGRSFITEEYDDFCAHQMKRCPIWWFKWNLLEVFVNLEGWKVRHGKSILYTGFLLRGCLQCGRDICITLLWMGICAKNTPQLSKSPAWPGLSLRCGWDGMGRGARRGENGRNGDVKQFGDDLNCDVYKRMRYVNIQYVIVEL